MITEPVYAVVLSTRTNDYKKRSSEILIGKPLPYKL